MHTTNVRIPKYVTIKNTLIKKIENGTYLPGDAIPSDNELMRSLGVSKSTITQALKNLEAEGYIIRQQGKGSFVAPNPAWFFPYICVLWSRERSSSGSR